MNKEEQIASIKQRILDEHRKHKDLDWAEIAARKIYSTHLVKEKCNLPDVSPRIDWVELRNNFFNECTTETPREEYSKKVNLTPHDLFEWLKREILEYVG